MNREIWPQEPTVVEDSSMGMSIYNLVSYSTSTVCNYKLRANLRWEIYFKICFPKNLRNQRKLLDTKKIYLNIDGAKKPLKKMFSQLKTFFVISKHSSGAGKALTLKDTIKKLQRQISGRTDEDVIRSEIFARHFFFT